MMKTLSLISLFLISIFVSIASRPGHLDKPSVTAQATPANNSAQRSEQPLPVTVCELKENPGKYNHKVVKLAGFFSHGFENSNVYDPSCESRFNIWFEYGGKNVTGTMYCCGRTAARERPEQLSVENIAIPLIADAQFKKFDGMLHEKSDSIVHALVIGRFFSGKKVTGANGGELWMGYGHMGMSSLLAVQQVVNIDPRDRSDLDYRASPDQPRLGKSGCGYRRLTELEPFQSLLELQKQAESGTKSWAFTDPHRAALDALITLTKRPTESIKKLGLTRQAQGRMIYEWQPPGERKTYMIVMSRPYEMSFYAKTNQVAWLPIAAYESSCE